GSNCGTASGKIIYDVNGSCIQDPGDYAVSNRHVQLGGGALAITNNQGFYTFSNIGLNTHAISQTLNTPFVANACTQPTSFTLSASNTSVSGLDFSDSLVSFVDAGVFMLNSGIVPGFGGSYYLYAHNNSNVNVNVNLSFVLSNLLTYIGSSVSPIAVNPSSAGDSISWALTLPPLSQNTMIQIQFNTPSTLVAGMPFLSRGHIQVTNAADVYAANNLYQYTAISTSSFDPNVKNVNPPGEGPNGNITLQQKVLDYTVHFQNTGTSAAHRVIILDTLSSRVDISTLEVMAYSHNYKIEVLGTNVLKFTFDNIMLPDSNTNEPESHGYISYRIHQSSLNQLGHQIKNTASIYFDFNAPVVTNTTLNTIVAPTNIGNVQKQTLAFAIYPNPAKDQCSLSFVGREAGSMQVQMINSIGQVIRTQTVLVHTGENEISLNVQGLTPGLYNIRLQQGEFQGNKSLLIK
ncbi:MAG TPA: T9SS type A sorting domain-containing protein, partial [Chitinophagaceae bacterium]|nr:T9SS type A sorting domain-containing protein [Chitinophagaceae bacterium]